LRDLGLVSDESGTALQAGPGERADLLFAAAIASEAPLWLEDADTLIQTPDDLPGDALALAETLQLGEARAMAAIRQAHGKLDLERRKEVGALGERLLVVLLEEQWPGATRHVSEQDDGLGYDVELRIGETTWKLEVKSTTRRNRLRIYLSRNEFSVGSLLREWRLIVLGLGQNDQIEALATVTTPYLLTVAPEDTASFSRWESASFELAPEQLSLGLSFIDPALVHARASLLAGGRAGGETTFTWMPAGT
jgi:hypothetical protein